MEIMERKKIFILSLLIFFLLFPLYKPYLQAAGYNYGNYYNLNLTNTSTGTTKNPAINGKGDKIVFWSDRELESGQNPTNANQVFLWTSPSSLTQLSSLDSVSGDVGNSLPSISFDGTRVTYIKNTWEGFAKYLMLWDTGTTQIIAQAPFKEIDSCKISGNGTKVVFRSNNAFVGGPDTSYELYLWEEGSGVTTKITSTQSANAPDTSFSINYDGNLVAFATKENTGTFAGKNPDGNWEIYLWNKNDSSYTQIAPSSGGTGSKEPSITSYTRSMSNTPTTVTQIAFTSDRDFLGTNPDLNPEIFLWTLYGSYSSSNTGSLTQITSTAVSGGVCQKPNISRDGRFITFVSNVDIISGGKSLLTGGTSAIFLWNAKGSITQINTQGDDPVISSSTGLYESEEIQYGPRITYYSQADGSDDIYLATSTIPVPVLNRWGWWFLVLLLIALAFFMLKKRTKSNQGEA